MKPKRKRPTLLAAARGSAPVFALPYADLQEIHTLVGMVCGWNMSLPTKMILQAKAVERRMITLNRIDLTQRQRIKEAKAFIVKFNAMFGKAQNEH
jgi:hypothetical protein